MTFYSWIAVETESGILATDVRRDDGPGKSGMIGILRRLARRHGVSKVVSTLLQTPASWFSFDGNPSVEHYHELQSDELPVELIDGFGIRRSARDYEDPTSFIPFDVAYIYLITADGTLRWADCRNSICEWEQLQWRDAGALT